LSVDHRVIDGALGAAFLEALKQNLEHPIGMLA
jgi:pyruvate dehydrogenase E2 component (dihydrolipoamide acetyltransferase)